MSLLSNQQPQFQSRNNKPHTHLFQMSSKVSFILFVMTSVVYAISIDCPNVVILAQGLGMQTAQPAKWAYLQSDCCSFGFAGTICDGNQRVTEIWWYDFGLNGTINGNAIPSSLLVLYLTRNFITGVIPKNLPSGLTHLYVHGNQMSGDLPSFPSTIQIILLGYPGTPGNHFSGSLRLNRPIQVYINDNWIANVVIQDSSVLGTGGYICDLSNNPLLGNSNIAGLTKCTQDGLYSANLLSLTRKFTTTLAKTTTELTTISKDITTSFTTTDMTTEMTYDATTDATTMVRLGTSTLLSTYDATTDATTMVRLGTTTNATSLTSINVHVVQQSSTFSVNLGMVVRVLINWMLLTTILNKSPFLRELKRATKRLRRLNK